MSIAGDATALQGVQVLVLDDDQDSCDLLQFALTTAGATVTAVASVEAAKTSFLAHQPQLVISDLAMPDATGYDFIQWVRSLSSAAGRHVPVLTLTAMASQLDRQQALHAGFNAHLSKPVDLDRLMVLLEQLLQTAPLSQGLASQAAIVPNN